MKDLFVFILRFEDRAALARAFEILSEEDSIASCAVEPEELRIRFLATPAIGSPLVERVYGSGGLTWSNRYPLRDAT